MEIKIIPADETKIKELENGSAFTWEGLSGLENDKEVILDDFKKADVLDDVETFEFYTWKGELMNQIYQLIGANAYPEDLTFVSIPLNMFKNIGKLAILKLQLGARWLDERYLKDMGVRNPCKKAFLAGLKAGKDMAEADLATIAYMQGAERYKTKWHKVADGDLPKPNIAVLICFQFEKWTTTYIAYYRPAIKKWQMYNLSEAQRQPIDDDYIDSEEVIAWCEIPTFTDKE